MLTHRSNLAACTIFVLVTGPVFSQDQPKPEDGATARAKAYLQCYKSKNYAEVPSYWDWSSVAEGVFLEEYTKLNEAQRKELTEACARMVKAALLNPQISEILSQAT